MSKSVGIIDIGTNTVLCLKADISNGIKIISDNRFHYRAGRRLDEAGNISNEYKTGLRKAILSALRIIQDCAEIKITASEVLRKPKDGANFAKELSSEINHHIEIISPQKEAELSFLGAVGELENSTETLAVVDIGGGSTELAIGRNGKLDDWAGIKIGAVTISELVGYGKPVESYLEIANKTFAESDFAELLNPAPDRMVVVGGSAVAIAAIMAKLDTFQPDKLKEFEIKKDNLVRLLGKLESMAIDNRKQVMVFDRQRADIIVAGGAIVLSFMKYFGFKKMQISINGLRHGLLLEQFSQLNA